MTLGATVKAPDAFAFLPQCMCVVGLMGLAIALIYAAAVEECLETSFVGPFVDGQAAFRAFEVAGGLLVCVLICCLGVLLLHFQQLFDGAGTCEFLTHWLVWSEIRLWCLMCQEFTVLLKVLFDDFDCETLMDSGVARVALVAAPVWGPLVFVGLPWELALVDESLLVLLGVVPCSADWLLVDVVLRVFVDFLQSGRCLLVDLQVILVQCLLPVFCLSVIERAGSLVGR